jgi:uncharacterized membrane protein
MKRTRVASVLMLTLAVLLVGLAGCNKSEQGGGTGSESFTMSAPATSTKIKQGDTRTVNITLNRGKNFSQTVRLSATASKGITPDVSPTMVKAADSNNEVKLTIAVAEDMPPGDQKVTVTATPERGNTTSVEVPVTVEKK